MKSDTRWDESLPITDSFVELVLDALGYSEAQLPRGVALLFVAHAVPWLGGQRRAGCWVGEMCWVRGDAQVLLASFKVG